MRDFDDNAFAARATSVLREHGPLGLGPWASALGEYGAPAAVAEALEYLAEPTVGRLPDQRYCALDTVLEGLVFTHRVSDLEIASDALDTDPDLLPILAFGYDANAAVRVAETAAEGFTSRRVLTLPPGTLAECAAGDLVGVAVEDGQLAIRCVNVEDLVDLTPALGDIFEENGVEALDAVCWLLAAEDPTLFTVPIAPLSELLGDAGYESERELLAGRGFDFAAYDAQIHIAEVAETYGLSYDEATATVAFVEVADRGCSDSAIAEFDLADWARRHVHAAPDSFLPLADPGVAVAVFDLGFRNQDRTTDAILEALALELAARGPRSLRAAAWWLAGKAADRLGRVLDAEAHYEDALGAESDWGPALFELAQFASDRGDATRALSLLGRIAGGAEEDLYRVLQEFVPVQRADLGRNDKCWCGSGRKYKTCHLGKVDESVATDGRWLYQKACLFAFASEFADQVSALDELSTSDLSEDELAVRTIFDGPALDTALFEGGIFAQFLRRRGALLSEAEIVTATGWLGVERSVYEWVELGESGTTLRECSTDETLTVTTGAEFAGLAAGDLLSARLLPVPAGVLAVGTVVLSSDLHAANLMHVLRSDAPAAEDLVRVLS